MDDVGETTVIRPTAPRLKLYERIQRLTGENLELSLIIGTLKVFLKDQHSQLISLRNQMDQAQASRFADTAKKIRQFLGSGASS